MRHSNFCQQCDVNLLGGNINAMEKNTEAVLVTSKEVDLKLSVHMCLIKKMQNKVRT
jgi:ferredoxin